METKDIIKWWKFPKATVINRNLPKNQIYPHMKSPSDKQFLQDEVQSIYMMASFKTDNTHIPIFENETELYQEVQFLYVATKDTGNSEKIYKLLSGLIPYPLVIIIEELESFTIYTGRFEKQSTGFLKLKNVYPSPVYQSDEAEEVLSRFILTHLPRQNLKVFYDGLRDELATELAKSQYGESIGDISGETKDKMDEINAKIEKLGIAIKKERQLNRKIDMQMERKKLKDELKSLIEK